MIYVMSDIHGREDRFNAILAQINMKRTDHLYILGDVIDRNPDGIHLLRRIARSKNMTMLLGNHEYMMLDAIDHPDDQEKMYLWRWTNCGDETWDKWKYCSKAFQNEMLTYLRSLPLNIEVSCGGKDWLLVHGGSEQKFMKKYGDEQKELIRHSLMMAIKFLFSMKLTDPDHPMKMCEHCQKAFIAKRADMRFCSETCRSKHGKD